MEVMYPNSAEITIIVSSLFLRVVPAIIFLVALYFVVRKAVRDGINSAKKQDPQS